MSFFAARCIEGGHWWESMRKPWVLLIRTQRVNRSNELKGRWFIVGSSFEMTPSTHWWCWYKWNIDHLSFLSTYSTKREDVLLCSNFKLRGIFQSSDPRGTTWDQTPINTIKESRYLYGKIPACLPVSNRIGVPRLQCMGRSFQSVQLVEQQHVESHQHHQTDGDRERGEY